MIKGFKKSIVNKFSSLFLSTSLFKSYSSNEDSDGNKETGLYLVRINYNADNEQEDLVGKLLDKHIYVEKDDEE